MGRKDDWDGVWPPGIASAGFGLAGRFRPEPPPLTLRECGAVGASRRLYSISKVRAVSLSTVMRTVTTFSGSSGSIFSGHSTRQRSPE